MTINDLIEALEMLRDNDGAGDFEVFGVSPYGDNMELFEINTFGFGLDDDDCYITLTYTNDDEEDEE